MRTTERGFSRIEFVDRRGVGCSLQASSLAMEDAVWLGCNNADPRTHSPREGWEPVPMPAEYVANTRMHLTREMVADLLPHLQKFVDEGSIR